MGPKAGLEVLEKTKIFCPCQYNNPRTLSANRNILHTNHSQILCRGNHERIYQQRKKNANASVYVCVRVCVSARASVLQCTKRGKGTSNGDCHQTQRRRTAAVRRAWAGLVTWWQSNQSASVFRHSHHTREFYNSEYFILREDEVSRMPV
jgi:hypothetical protein